MFQAYKNLEKLMMNDLHNTIEFGKIANHVRSLRLRGWPQAPINEIDLENMFVDINNFLVDKTSV